MPVNYFNGSPFFFQPPAVTALPAPVSFVVVISTVMLCCLLSPCRSLVGSVAHCDCTADSVAARSVCTRRIDAMRRAAPPVAWGSDHADRESELLFLETGAERGE